MAEVQLSKLNSQKTIVTRYENVIEYFWATKHDGGASMHIGHIKSIGIATDKKGKHTLAITTLTGRPFLNDEVDDQALGKVKQWVAEVQRAMQAAAL